MTDDRFVSISAEQAEWLRVAAKRMAFDDSLLAATAVIVEIAEEYDRAPRTRLGTLLGRTRSSSPAPLSPAPEPAPSALADARLASPAGPDEHSR
jgi:hypothetical protein